ncbi:amylo-alpha-1,6-glucosidase [Paenibacillus tengchongensis]|uniref:amylo-alpha-1,6-glucosidase n=1 Tax=Paenibacillus tengchongensis TaxID=2608684 RepID=UPI00124CFC8E|nr:amylo-alpha-1,6-glucosidase [Paenibacillus tengchongensis]
MNSYETANNAGESPLLDAMAIGVTAEENRAVSFTNKEAAFYYTQSHVNNHIEHAYFAGLNIAKNRIFGGYKLYLDGVQVDHKASEVWVYPYKMLRKHGLLTEELRMFDYRNALEVSLAGAEGKIGLALEGEQVEVIDRTSTVLFFSATEGGWIIAVSARDDSPLALDGAVIAADAAAGGFLIGAGRTAAEAAAVLADIRGNGGRYRAERTGRMERLLQQHVPLESSDPELVLALNWLNLTMDQLVTRQQGDGIYAGLPWFNEYWGRDQFISMPGAVLVSGRFATARSILLSFAEYQNTDESSRFFGRVPNILAPENIDYHTTDGTPRFVIQLQDYVKYSGDTGIIEQLYPAVKNSIEGSVRYWMDDNGYLTHDDNETWMDARDAELNSYSPRDTRANDIQALWYNQLRAGVYFAEYMQDTANAEKWGGIADRLARSFSADFTDAAHPYLADRLDADGAAEYSLRPNQLFAFDLLADGEFKWQALRTAWEELVYPWGTASLDRRHPFFHPYHLTEHYHKDEAYHNGTVWTWLNGIAMQRMIEAGQAETAFGLFRNMNRQALQLGVVGGLCENMDAYPHEGAAWATLTGAYLQAWSNAEQLRTWYQYVLGIRPDMIMRELTLAPRIPGSIKDVRAEAIIGEGSVEFAYSAGPEASYTYTFRGLTLTAAVDLAPFDAYEVEAVPDSVLQIKRNGQSLETRLTDSTGRLLYESVAAPADERLQRQAASDRIFDGVEFAQPLKTESHPVMTTTKHRKKDASE